MNPIFDTTAIRLAQEMRANCDLLVGVNARVQKCVDNYGPSLGALDSELTNNPTGVIQDLGGNDTRAPMVASELQALDNFFVQVLGLVNANGGTIKLLIAKYSANPRFFDI